MTRAELHKWEMLGYADGIANRDPHPPLPGESVKSADAYKAGWWRGFAVYQRDKALPTAQDVRGILKS